MPALQTLNGKTAAGTNRDGLEFVFRTTHPARKDRTHVPYHDSHHARNCAFQPHP